VITMRRDQSDDRNARDGFKRAPPCLMFLSLSGTMDLPFWERIFVSYVGRSWIFLRPRSRL
jgi:hypothetical protein